MTNDGNLYTIYIGNKAPTSPSYYTIVLNSTAPSATEEAGAAIATENINAADANSVGGEILANVTPEMTAEAPAATADAASAIATDEATAESTAEATPNRILDAAVTLSGSQTIYVIPQTVIDTLTKWLPTPPYAPLPTAAPTDIIPLETLTPEPTVAPTAEVTAEVTTEATAEATVAP